MPASRASKLSLTKWRQAILDEADPYSIGFRVDAFPDEETRESYLRQISKWSEHEIRSVLRNFVGQTRGITNLDNMTLSAWYASMNKGTLPLDDYSVSFYRTGHDPEARFTEFERRRIRDYLEEDGSEIPTHEGLTWVIDLLPKSPQKAITVIEAYEEAHIHTLSDWRIWGLGDALAIIRNRYIMQGGTTIQAKVSLLRTISPGDIEFLAAALYEAMEQYERVAVTPRQKDGGKDVVATRGSEAIFVECKNESSKVGVEQVRSFTGAIGDGFATRGIMISISGFTEIGPESAIKYASRDAWRSRLELVDGPAFAKLLNAHLGSDWHLRVDRVVEYEKLRQTRLADPGNQSD